MKRTAASAAVVFFALAIVGALAWFRYANASPLCYALVEWPGEWDEKTQHCIWMVLLVDDQQVLAQVPSWRDRSRREARERAFRAVRRLFPWLFRPYCDNALRQGLERLTLVYEDGHKEQFEVNVCTTPFGDCWREARRNRADVAPLRRQRESISTLLR